MRIDDLNHLIVTSEDVAVLGGTTWRFQADALALATADAIGAETYTETVTNAQAVAGLFSSSVSVSIADSTGFASA